LETASKLTRLNSPTKKLDILRPRGWIRVYIYRGKNDYRYWGPNNPKILQNWKGN